MSGLLVGLIDAKHFDGNVGNSRRGGLIFY
jgi:hypothetical protein